MPLYIIPTPIGNLQDITIRAVKVLFSVDIILAEDTRRTGNLLSYYREYSQPLNLLLQKLDENQTSSNIIINFDTKPKFISFHEHNENNKLQSIIELLKQKKTIALVSDAGTPLISDPGFKLIRECHKHKIKVISLPGANAAISALVTSGQPPNRFMFIGYLSPKPKRKLKELQNIQEAVLKLKKPPTIIIYEGPHKLINTLKSLLKIAGNINVTLVSELTKIHEKVIINSVSLLIAELSQRKNIKGEYTILFRYEKATKLEHEDTKQ